VLYGFGGACGLVGWSCDWFSLRLFGWVVFCFALLCLGVLWGGGIVATFGLINLFFVATFEIINLTL
jgi:hypothetical protein